jgi:hypothetical protein
MALEAEHAGRTLSGPCVYFFLLGFWLSALPADDFESLPVRSSRRTFDACLATFGLVTLFLAI